MKENIDSLSLNKLKKTVVAPPLVLYTLIDTECTVKEFYNIAKFHLLTFGLGLSVEG